MKDERPRPKSPRFARKLFLTVFVFLYIPLVTVVAGAFQSSSSPFFWFGEVLRDESMLDALMNSVTVGVLASLCSTIMGAGAAVAIHRSEFWEKNVLKNLSYISLVLPEIVFALALLSWFFLLGLHLNLFTVIIAHITFCISYVILTVGARLSTMDASLDDAAKDLGASQWSILWRVTIPILGPSLLSSFFLSFLLSFDDFLITFFVNGVGTDTLPVKLYTAMRLGITPKLNALASLMWLITGIVLFAAMKMPLFKNILKSE